MIKSWRGYDGRQQQIQAIATASGRMLRIAQYLGTDASNVR